MKKIVFFIIIGLIALDNIAQEVVFKASAPSVISTGSQFKIVYTINAKPSSFKNPSFEPFEVLMGPSTSSSTSISFINGQMTQDISYSYTYYLMANKEGKYTIPPAEIIVNGKSYKSNAIQIEVVKGNAPTSNYQHQQANANQATQSEATVSNEDVFIRIQVNKHTVYQGEQLVASVYIYTRLNVVGFEELKFPNMTGFWSEDLETPNQIQLRQEYINGQLYNVGLLKRVILSPNRSGKLTIDPVVATVIVQQRVQSRRRSIFDDFFGTYQNVSKKLVSPPVTINVKPLPENKPTPFSGGVGNFTLETNADNTQLKMNEAFTYSIHLNGKGNLKLVDIPRPNFPTDFEVYDPKTTEKITAKDGTTQGSKTISYIIIPRHHGQYTIPGLTFHYFDLASKSYKTIKTEDIVINVSKDSTISSTAVISEFTKKDISVLGSDIRYIKKDVEPLHPINQYIFSHTIYRLAYPTTFMLLVFLLFIRREQIKQRSNLMAMRNRKASKVASKRLALAKKYLQQNNDNLFYEETTKALWGYLSDKLMIPTAELSKEKAIDVLKSKNINEELIKELFETIEICEFARYAPSTVNQSKQDIYQRASKHIDELERII